MEQQADIDNRPLISYKKVSIYGAQNETYIED